MAYVGRPVRRREDRRLVTGAGSYVDDVPVANALHAVFVRSPHARARIAGLDVSAAERLPGVRWVITAADLPPASAPHHVLLLPPGVPDVRLAAWGLLAKDEVRYVGEPVAMVVAEDPRLARDAADLVEVDYEPLPAVSDLGGALQPGANLVHPTFGTNQALRLVHGSPLTDTDAALAASDRVVHLPVRQRRLAGAPMEPRATIAQYDPYSESLVVWASTQSAHGHAHNLAEALGIPDNKLRVITRDVGGAFGLKNHIYGDEAALAYVAWTRRCAIRWSESRSESLQTTFQGRGVGADVSLGVQRDGTLTALKVDIWADLGAYVLHESLVTPMSFASSIVGPYRIPTATAIVTGIYSNRVPTSPYRGAGRPEATYAIERAVDAAARAIGMDPAEIRRRNFIPPDAFPYRTPVGAVYDSGDYLQAFEKALEAADYDRMRQRQNAGSGGESLLGIGLCAFVESSVPGWESATVRVDRGGKVTLLTGSSAHGQGHHTTFSQVVADALSVPMDDVEVIHGDTAAVPQGIGTFGSRSAALGGSSALIAAGKVRDKMLRIAAHMLEADAADVELAGGKFQLVGAPSRAVPFAAVAGLAHVGMGLPPGVSPGLEATEFFAHPGLSFPFGTHVAIVEVQTETGEVAIQRYVSVDDCGTVLNPLLVEGQMHGGLAQGFGQALIEEVAYDETGQVATGTLLDYALPRADLMPIVELGSTVTPSPLNPLGVKGVGEAGTVAAPPALVNAAVDALAPLGVTDLEMPLTPQRVWAAIQAARASGAREAAEVG